MTIAETLTLKASIRDITGKEVRQVRQQDLIPAVVYGHEHQSQAIAIARSAFEQVYNKAGETTVIQLELGKEKPLGVLVYDVQFHNVKGNIIHVDFRVINMAEKIVTHVPILTVGEAPAVKELGGTLVHVISELEVESLPADIPHEIEVDVSGIKTFDQMIRVEDLPVDKSKVEILTEADQVVVSVQEPRSEEELADLESTPEEVDVSTVEGAVEDKEEGEEDTEKAEPAEETKEAKE